MLKGVFKLPLRALEGFINSLFKLHLAVDAATNAVVAAEDSLDG